jgi:hypothetical protein
VHAICAAWLRRPAAISAALARQMSWLDVALLTMASARDRHFGAMPHVDMSALFGDSGRPSCRAKAVARYPTDWPPTDDRGAVRCAATAIGAPSFCRGVLSWRSVQIS